MCECKDASTCTGRTPEVVPQASLRHHHARPIAQLLFLSPVLGFIWLYLTLNSSYSFCRPCACFLIASISLSFLPSCFLSSPIWVAWYSGESFSPSFPPACLSPSYILTFSSKRST